MTRTTRRAAMTEATPRTEPQPSSWFRKIVAGSFLALLALLCSQVFAETAKPNILLIYTDDHGWADFGAQGADKDIRTPNLDQFARDGVILKRGYVTAPQCTPSRVGVISGMYQQRFGVEDNRHAMKQEVVTLPERLKTAGYITGMCGKWTLDIEIGSKPKEPKIKVLPELAPQHQGFDEYFTGSLRDYVASYALDGTPFADAPHKVHDERCRVNGVSSYFLGKMVQEG